jgi:hypothetical protein
MKTLSINIDVTKIEKQRLYVGKKGTYLDAVVFLRDETDEYGNDGFVVQSVTKEERESGKKGEILGNVKIIGQKEEPKVEPEEDGLPF